MGDIYQSSYFLNKLKSAITQLNNNSINLKRPKSNKKPGQLITINNVQKLIVIGDTHIERRALEKVIKLYEEELKANESTQVILIGDIISSINQDDYDYYEFFLKHGDNSKNYGSRYQFYEAYKKDTGNKAFDLLTQVVYLKCIYPNNFHILVGNGELGFTCKRASKEFYDKYLKLPIDTKNAIKNFINTLPLFLIINIKNGKKYLLSHGGIVNSNKLFKDASSCTSSQSPYYTLINFVREGIKEEYDQDKSKNKKEFDLIHFEKICYTNVETKQNPEEYLRKICEYFKVDEQICGHIHLFGSKQQQINDLKIKLNPNRSITYGKTENEILHIINSMGMGQDDIYTYLEVTINGIEVKTC